MNMRIDLQNLVLPNREVNQSLPLYFAITGPKIVREEEREVYILPKGKVATNTEFNLFNAKKWFDLCAISDLELRLSLSGRFVISFFAYVSKNERIKFRDEMINTRGLTENFVFSIPEEYEASIIYFEIIALDETTLSEAVYSAHTSRSKDDFVKLAISITTFRREAETLLTINRLREFIIDNDLSEILHCFVVDNGKSVDVQDDKYVSYIPNDNLGGSGGFARGLLEAQKKGFTHCLFTDDDASFQPETLYRTLILLSLAKDPKTAVIASMINALNPSEMWEYGACFNQWCRPQYHALNLYNQSNLDFYRQRNPVNRDQEFFSTHPRHTARNAQELFDQLNLDFHEPETIVDREWDTANITPKNLYGGWWYYAFPIAYVEYYPFPFFVRGDDVSFSLANNFTQVRLNGITSFQDGFTDKETPLTWYLDLRSHLAHHLSLPNLEIGRLSLLKTMIWFMARTTIRFKYETAKTCVMAIEDILKGPDFFDKNKDTIEIRKKISKIVRNEKPRPVGEISFEDKPKSHASRGWRRYLYRLTLNGHLIPFFNRTGRRNRIFSYEKGKYEKVWGASHQLYLSADNETGYLTIQSKKEFFAIMYRFLGLCLRFWREYDDLKDRYQKAYPEMASRKYWLETYEKDSKLSDVSAYVTN